MSSSHFISAGSLRQPFSDSQNPDHHRRPRSQPPLRRPRRRRLVCTCGSRSARGRSRRSESRMRRPSTGAATPRWPWGAMPSCSCWPRSDAGGTQNLNSSLSFELQDDQGRTYSYSDAFTTETAGPRFTRTGILGFQDDLRRYQSGRPDPALDALGCPHGCPVFEPDRQRRHQPG